MVTTNSSINSYTYHVDGRCISEVFFALGGPVYTNEDYELLGQEEHSVLLKALSSC